MAVYDQQVTTYSDTTPHKRVISDIIQLIDPVDTPLIDVLGGLDSARSKFQVGLNGYKVELLEDSYAPLSTESAGTTGMTNDTTLTDFSVTDASIFQVGHVIKMDSEYCVVSAVDASGDTISVYNRTYGGTNATHATDEAIEIVGMARLEGDDADFGPIVDVTAPYNYTGIFQKGLNVSRSQRAISQWGKKVDEFSYQAMKAVPELLRLVEKSIFQGIRSAGSASVPRSFGGLGTFIGSNTVAAGGAIAKADIDGLAEQIMIDGGNPDLLVLHPSIANDLRTLLDSSSFVRVDQENQGFGMRDINRVRTQYGELRMVVDRWCPLATAYMLDSSKVGLYTLDPFAWEELGKTGDGDKAEVVGEFSLLVSNDLAHGTITGITS